MSKLAFNSYAKDYDKHFTHSPIGLMQRKRVFNFFSPLLNNQKRVLEINCGTGEDAIFIAQQAKSILATDNSSEMLKEATAKKAKHNLDNLMFEPIDIKELKTKLFTPFDLLFSNFGGLNCLNSQELINFSSTVSSSISNKGQLVLVIMGKKCIWENFFFLWQKDSRYKRRNTNKGINTEINGSTFLTYYYSPKEISTLFAKDFKTILVKPIGLFIPPSYLNSYFENKSTLLRILNIFESILGNFSSFANYADHFLIILEKKNSVGSN